MTHVLLAIDDLSLPLRRNVCLYLSTPTVRPEPVLAPSPLESAAPDNLAAHFYGTVLHDGGRYRMWYYACHRGRNPDWPPRLRQQVARQPGWLQGVAAGQEITQGPLCYAESDDGIAWTKPALDQVPFKGSRRHNALALPHTVVSGAAVLRDDGDPDPARRYKMVYQYIPDQTDPPMPEYGRRPTVACATSPDGLRWTVTALPFVDQFVEPCSFIQHQGQYILHSQAFPGSGWSGVHREDGTAGGRTGVAHATSDFDRWPDYWQMAFALPEPRDPAARGAGLAGGSGYDQVHLGIGAASLGNVCVGLYGLWHDRPDFGQISGDLGLLVSSDGIRFREPAPAPGHAYVRRQDSPATPAPGREFPTILCQGNGILNVGGQTRIYHGRWRNVGQQAADIAAHYRAEVALATLPRDRWGALGLDPGAEAGATCSAPVALSPRGAAVCVNAEGASALRVDLLDAAMRPIPGFEDGRPEGGDGLEVAVRWDGHTAADLGGHTVRVQVRLRRLGEALPRVYAAYVMPG
ncbi:MAG: hypothetical protein ABIL09_03420 [Gemmatimonadota bacterium]